MCIFVTAFCLLVQSTNTTLTFSQRQTLSDEENSNLQTQTTFLVPHDMRFITTPSLVGVAGAPFKTQPALQLYDIQNRWVQNVGFHSTSSWLVEASLLCGNNKNYSCNSSIQLLGNTTVPFVNGTANFRNLAVSRNGTDYVIVINVTSPSYVKISISFSGIDILSYTNILPTFLSPSTTTSLSGNISPALPVDTVEHSNALTLVVVCVVVVILIFTMVFAFYCYYRNTRHRRKRCATVTSEISILNSSFDVNCNATVKNLLDEGRKISTADDDAKIRKISKISFHLNEAYIGERGEKNSQLEGVGSVVCPKFSFSDADQTSVKENEQEDGEIQLSEISQDEEVHNYFFRSALDGVI